MQQNQHQPELEPGLVNQESVDGHLAQDSEQHPEGGRHPGEEEHPVEERYPGEEELRKDEQEHLVGKVTLCNMQDI